VESSDFILFHKGEIFVLIKGSGINIYPYN
jgi:hypothetical protein